MENLPPHVTLPAVVWRNVAEDLRAIADAVDAQLASFRPRLADEAYLTLDFGHPPLHAALEQFARAQVGDEVFEELMANASAEPDDEGG